MRDFLFRLADGFRRLHREEEGGIIACSLAVFLFLYVLGCGVYALGTTIYEREALQNAADAAAYSAATIQADALSRMAMLNKALSYTYVQMSRKQMDCITAKWLSHVAASYAKDRADAEKWTAVWFWPSLRIPVSWLDAVVLVVQFIEANNDAFPGQPFSMRVDDPAKKGYCPLQNRKNDTVANGGAWFCGYGTTPDAIALNGHPFPWSLVRQKAAEIASENRIGELEEAILLDKLTISGLNASLQSTHEAMCESIDVTIPAVLRRNLVATFGEDAKEEWYYSTKTPEATWNPYFSSAQTQAGDNTGIGGTTAGYYNVLHNTENDEWRLLSMAYAGQMGDMPTTLAEFFNSELPSKILQTLEPMQVHPTTMGIDQWFVRGGTNIGGLPSYVRQDGAAGIQRVYWDSNGNEGDLRGGGMSLSGKGPTRGNHLFEGTLATGSNPFVMLMEQITNDLLGNLLDFQASCHSWQGDARSCKHIGDSVSLVADWQWGGAKWICHVGNCKMYWDLTAWKRATSRGGRPWRKKYYPYACARRHYAWPKFYVGGTGGALRHPRFQGNGDTYPDFNLIWEHLQEMAGFGETRSEDAKRGYAEGSGLLEAAKGIKAWVTLHKNGSNGVNYPAIRREDARECAISAAMDALFLRGYVRVYGDDRGICHPHEEVWTKPDGSRKTLAELIKEVDVYAGARAEPWILSERFFGPDGTIFVAVAKRRRNPWAQLAGAVAASVRNLASIGNPEGTHPTVEGTFMWTVSAGRAAFRDPETGELCGHYKYLNPEGQNDALGAHEPGESGCVCDTAPERLRRQWNLCVTEWEPTLVPVAVADAFRAVEDAGGRGCFVPNPQPETSGLAKVLHWDLDGGERIATASEEEHGWLPLSGTGSAKKEDTFLQVVAPPGTDQDKRFGPKDGADWPKTLWPRKLL